MFGSGCMHERLSCIRERTGHCMIPLGILRDGDVLPKYFVRVPVNRRMALEIVYAY